MRLLIFSFCFSILFLLSCSSYNKLLKSNDTEAKYSVALEYYESGDYYRTIQLLEGLIVSYRGSLEAENIYYYYASSHYKMGDYLMAAYHFSNLAKTLPNSKYAEEALYMVAYCKYLHSPSYYLDQSNTRTAIQDMQLFINRFPKSEKIPEANKLIDEMRAKIELKTYENAKMFFNMEGYNASINALETFIHDYPGTKFEEEASFLILKSWHQFALGSFTEKKLERFEKAKQQYELFSIDFPNSKFKNEAEAIYNSSVKNIDKLLTESKK